MGQRTRGGSRERKSTTLSNAYVAIVPQAQEGPIRFLSITYGLDPSSCAPVCFIPNIGSC